MCIGCCIAENRKECIVKLMIELFSLKQTPANVAFMSPWNFWIVYQTSLVIFHRYCYTFVLLFSQFHMCLNFHLTLYLFSTYIRCLYTSYKTSRDSGRTESVLIPYCVHADNRLKIEVHRKIPIFTLKIKLGVSTLSYKPSLLKSFMYCLLILYFALLLFSRKKPALR